MTLEEMLAMSLNERRFGVVRVPGGWIYEGKRDSGVFVPEPTEDPTPAMMDHMEALMTERNREVADGFEQNRVWITKAIQSIQASCSERFKHYDKVLADCLSRLGYHTLGSSPDVPETKN